MHLRCAGFVVALLMSSIVLAQYQAPAESISLSAQTAYTWSLDGTRAVQLLGPVRIELDHNSMSADQAVVWITPQPQAIGDAQRVEIALVGNAQLRQPNGITRSGERLYVDSVVRGAIRLIAQNRSNIDQAQSELYQAAAAIRPVPLTPDQGGGAWVVQSPEAPATQPTTQPTDRFRPGTTISLSYDNLVTQQMTESGRVAAVLSGNVAVFQKGPDGFLELRADRAVIFTTFDSLDQLRGQGQLQSIEQAVEGAFLEGDVRMSYAPADPAQSEQRLTANRAYYDFTTDRAVLTDVVLHTSDPSTNLPIVLRAEKVRQLSRTPTQTEFSARDAQLSTSAFHTPSYSIGASSVYMRISDTGDPAVGARATFLAWNPTFDVYGVPAFYLPAVGGTFTEHGWLRRIGVGNSKDFGFTVETVWGLFETLGRVPPAGTDASFRLDYFSDRGPAFGLDVEYVGGSVSETTLEPQTYSGDFTSYFVFDHGVDNLGRKRLKVEPEDDQRGMFYWQHQHFFPDDWQVQLSGGLISDPTFMEEWFTDEFYNSRPLDTAFYAKRQRQSEAFTFLVSVQPNDFTTVADLYQEQFEVERLPEIGYRRIGDSWWDDRATFFSENTLAALSFDNSDYTLEELGFRPAPVGRQSPGIKSIGYTGSPEETTYRGDFRQELDLPMTAGEFKIVPYVTGRYTGYSESVEGGSENRLYAGTGIRATTAFWKIDNSVESDLFDLHRLRHVVEPELELHAAAQRPDRSDLLIYDEQVDGISDFSAVSVALLQRWQTKRGGPGRWRSVNAFTLDLRATHYFNQPPEEELIPTDFRGLYFVSMPAASIPRDSVEANFGWQVSDNVRIFSDANYNTEESELATAAVGLNVTQLPRLSYYIALRHIGIDLDRVIDGNTFVFENQDLLIFAIDYQLTRDYRINFANSYDIAQHRNNRSMLTLIRAFDRFYASVSFRLDAFEDERAVFFNLWPEGFAPASPAASPIPF